MSLHLCCWFVKCYKSLCTLVVTFFETYRYIVSISRRLHLMFLMLSIAETIIDVNKASSSGKGFSLFLLRVLSLPSRSEEIIRPSPAGNYMLKVNNRNSRTRCEICSKLTIKTPERRQWRCSGVFNANFEHISHLALVFLLLTLNM